MYVVRTSNKQWLMEFIYSGQGAKICSLSNAEDMRRPHVSATPQDLKLRLLNDRETRAADQTPARVVFERTLGRLAAYRKHGCGADMEESSTQQQGDVYSENRDELSIWQTANEQRRCGFEYSSPQCDGLLLLSYTYDRNPYVQ